MTTRQNMKKTKLMNSHIFLITAFIIIIIITLLYYSTSIENKNPEQTCLKLNNETEKINCLIINEIENCKNLSNSSEKTICITSIAIRYNNTGLCNNLWGRISRHGINPYHECRIKTEIFHKDYSCRGAPSSIGLLDYCLIELKKNGVNLTKEEEDYISYYS